MQIGSGEGGEAELENNYRDNRRRNWDGFTLHAGGYYSGYYPIISNLAVVLFSNNAFFVDWPQLLEQGLLCIHSLKYLCWETNFLKKRILVVGGQPPTITYKVSKYIVLGKKITKNMM